MSENDIRALAHATYDAINARDTVRLNQLFAPGVIRHAMGEIGVDKAVRAVESLPAGKRFVVHDVLVEGHRAALRVEVQDDAAEPSGQPRTVIMEIFRIEDGQIAEVWGAGSTPKPMVR